MTPRENCYDDHGLTQVEAEWRMQLSRRTAALSDANRRFTELESVMRRIASRSSVG